MSDEARFPVSDEWARRAWIDEAGYRDMYRRSIDDPDGFWGEHGKRIDWIRPYSRVKNTDFTGNVRVRWYEDGELNACANCLDRHLDRRGDQPAIIWEGDDPADSKTLTYRDLHAAVSKFANGLKAAGVGKGDTVTIYMPMIPEAAVAMLACARIGAPHSVVFGGFSADSLASRIQDCNSKLVITADEGVRGGKIIPLKASTDAAVAKCPGVEKVIVVRRTGGDIEWIPGRDLWYHELI
ncbi:MAG: AMP-binding protein, partial [Proteobacteria bacterium]|nr:AMP-binding protein [Pseudomonadota bacterium]